MIFLNDQLFTDAAICWAISGLIKMIYWLEIRFVGYLYHLKKVILKIITNIYLMVEI